MNAEPSNVENSDGSVDASELSRRRFFARLSLALGAGATAALAAPAAGFVLAPLFHRKVRDWRLVGRIENFQIGQTVDVRYEDASPLEWAGVTARTAAWLRRESADRFVAFSIHCTHLGCPVRWLPRANLFMCPCHGGVYYQDGSVAAGPPPQPLAHLPVRLVGDRVEILTAPIPIA